MGASGAPWLTVVGMDDSGPASLPPRALAEVEAAELLVGGERHHALFPLSAAERLVWRRPIEHTLDAIEARRGRRVVVLASGDPFCFGIGTTLGKRFGPEDMTVLPAPSSATLACARLHWPVADVGLVSLSDGLVARVIRYLRPGRRLIVFSRDETTPAEVASVFRDHGYGPSRLVILEHLGGERERVVTTTAGRFEAGRVARLNLLAIECAAVSGVSPLSTSPGLPDDAFENDGMLTRSEVRALTLARLQPARGERLLDVGAGSGSIAIEWLRAAGEGSAVAVERDPKRCAIIRRNALALGAPEVEVVEDEAPQCLEGLPAADAVFIGGGLTRDGLLAACLGKLRPGGRLVANAVTLEGEQALIGFRAEHGGGLVRLALSCLEPVGRLHGWRPAMPVTQLTFVR